MYYVLSPNIFTLNSATQLLTTEDISKIFILTTQPLSFYRSSSLDLCSFSTIEALDSCSFWAGRFSYCSAHPHDRIFTSSPALLNWLVSCISCVCFVWCSNFYFFTNPAQNPFSYVFKGREYERQSIILESDPCINCNNLGTAYSQNGDDCRFLLFPVPAFINALPST